jgi:hypothetical protein
VAEQVLVPVLLLMPMAQVLMQHEMAQVLRPDLLLLDGLVSAGSWE